MQRFGWLALAGALLLGTAWRIAACSAEFWFDEVLSWELSRQAGSLEGVFSLRHDNNHHLNTAWLTIWPPGKAWSWYRLHSLGAGLLTILLAWMVARAWGEVQAVFAAFLFAENYWLVVASVEARGYALAVLFALLAFQGLRRYLDQRSGLGLGTFWGATIFGFLSHLSFVHAYLGFLVWSLRRFARQRQRPGEELRQWLICHAGILFFFAPFYLFCIRGMHVEGGPPGPLLPVVGRLLALGLGGPDQPWWTLGAALLFLGVTILALIQLARTSGDVWVCFLVIVVLSPTLFLLRRPPFLFERYFLISFVFFLLLLGFFLGFLWNAGGLLRALSLGLLLLYLLGQAVHLTQFVRTGRGCFAEALAWILQQDASPTVHLMGDDDFRVEKMLSFHADYFPNRRLVYVSNQQPGKVDWVLVHRLDAQHPPAEEIRDLADHRYRLVRAYPSPGREAWGWFVYRRVQDQPAPKEP